MSFGAVGQIENNNIINNVFIGNNAFTVSGVFVFASSKVRVTGNTIGNNQFGIAAESTTGATADNTTIKNNVIFGTVHVDGIDLCSNYNVVSKNRIANSGQSDVDLDSGCGTTGNNNSVTHNTINFAPVFRKKAERPATRLPQTSSSTSSTPFCRRTNARRRRFQVQ